MAEKNSAVVSIGMGLAVGALVGMFYQHAMPTLIDHRVGDPEDPHAASALKTVTITSAGVVTAVALIAKDPTVFVIGGAVVIGMNLWHRHANLVHPETGRATTFSPAMAGDPGPSPDMAYDADNS